MEDRRKRSPGVQIDMRPGINQWPGAHPVAAPATVQDILARHRVRFVSCLGWRVGADWSIPERVLGDSFFFVPLAGRVLMRCRDQEEELRPGQIAILPEGLPHAARHAPGNRRFDVLSLHAIYRSPSGASSLDGVQRIVWPLADAERWMRDLKRLASWHADHPDLGVAAGQILSRLLLAELVAAGLPIVLRQPRIHPRLAPILAQVQDAPGSAWRIADLAQRAGISPVRFRQLFHEATGQSPKAWLDRVRLDHASALLQGSDQPVAAIANACGFSGIRQFQVRFKSVFGTSPSLWRQQSGL